MVIKGLTLIYMYIYNLYFYHVNFYSSVQNIFLWSFFLYQVSYFASCSCLSNQKEFPTFMRTMPSDAFQTKALARLVSHFHWTWVGVIGLESDYARFAIQLFLQEAARYNVCAAYVHFLSLPPIKDAVVDLVKTMKKSSARVVLSVYEIGRASCRERV